MLFIPPCIPTLRSEPPSGQRWVHEIKFDGWRVQLHKHGTGLALYTRNGNDCAWMLPALQIATQSASLRDLPGVSSAVIDGELVACDGDGLPDFYALHFRRHGHALCVWAFDLLHLNGRDLRELPLHERKAKLVRLLTRVRVDWLHLSETFADGTKLLAEAERMRLEGIVSKHVDAPYRSGKRSEWVKN
jgi:bifunctional non-homologous end joining protein LigD